MLSLSSVELLNAYKTSDDDDYIIIIFNELKRRGHVVRLLFYNYDRLINAFRECDQPEELALLYKEFMLRQYGIKFLELDTRDKKLVSDMLEIYRAM